MKRALPYILRRLLFLIPQLLLAMVVAFLLVRLQGEDKTVAIALGFAQARPEAVEAMRENLGFNDPLPVQFINYVVDVVQGDWGQAVVTKRPVLDDIANRLPATLTLITISLIISVIIGVVVGMIAALRPTGIVNRVLTWYGFLAGAIPDFWMGLLLIFFFFALWGILPSPTGQLAIGITPPPARTNVVIIDSIIAGDGRALKDALLHLILPVTTLVLVYTAPILKITAATVDKMRHERFVVAARAHGVKTRILNWYMLRNSLPPVVTVIGVIYVFLLGGAVLVEQVFSWNGFGQYAVRSILEKDVFPIRGFLLVAAAFTMLIYLIVDVFYALIDPRVKL